MTLKKWNLKGEILKSVNLDAMILSMDTFKGKLFTGDSLGRIEVYDLNLEKKASFEVHQGWIWQTKYYGGSLFSVSDTGSIIKTSIEGQSTTLFEYKEGLFSMEVSNELIYCGSESGTLIRYSIKTNERKEFNYHTDIIRSVKVIDKSILTASEDCTVCLNGQIIVQHENFVQDTIVFDSEIVSAGFSGELKKSNLYLKA
jgi:outer membrane protein assembly factor BamB